MDPGTGMELVSLTVQESRILAVISVAVGWYRRYRGLLVCYGHHREMPQPMVDVAGQLAGAADHHDWY